MDDVEDRSKYYLDCSECDNDDPENVTWSEDGDAICAACGASATVYDTRDED